MTCQHYHTYVCCCGRVLMRAMTAVPLREMMLLCNLTCTQAEGSPAKRLNIPHDWFYTQMNMIYSYMDSMGRPYLIYIGPGDVSSCRPCNDACDPADGSVRYKHAMFCTYGPHAEGCTHLFAQSWSHGYSPLASEHLHDELRPELISSPAAWQQSLYQ